MFRRLFTSVALCLSVQAATVSNLSRKTRQANNTISDGGCLLPEFPDNGKYTMLDSPKESRPGDRVVLYTLLSYSCYEGYGATDGSSVCQEDGKWTFSPKCVLKNNTADGCILPPFPSNGWYTIPEYDKSVVPGNAVGKYSVLEYECDKNFGPTASSSLCQDDGTWTASPECKTQATAEFEHFESSAVVGCSLPPFPANGRYTVVDYDRKIVPGDIVGMYTALEYSCETNFDLTAMTSLCQDHETWSASPECKLREFTEFASNESIDRSVKRKVCPLPNFPDHGWYVVPEYDKEVVPGDSVPTYTALTYFCKMNYDLTVAISLCLDNKTWSASPKCKIRASVSSQPPPGSGCPLPDFPYKGKYIVTNYQRDEKISFGDIVEPNTILQYSCNENYDLTDRFTQCQKDGTWSAFPECTSRCDMVTSYTVDFRCFSPAGVLTPCVPQMPRGSTVRSRCKAGHYPADHLGALVCEGGGWGSPVPKCRPDCGLESQLGVTHIINGLTVKKYAFPWHVTIYKDNGGPTPDQICGGSLIQTHIVVSAAHCFYDVSRNVPYSSHFYKVSAGNIYRSWDHELEKGIQTVQQSGLLKIRLHDRYGGDGQLHQGDVALLILETPFRISDSVRPVCYDLFYEENDKFQLTQGNVGKVAGFGLTSVAKGPSEELRTLSLPVIGYKDCVRELSKYQFSGYITTDKFCAGYLNGSAVCQGDSGGGLVFPVKEVTQTRWYLRGVVSNGPVNDENTGCRADTYTAFTHLFKLRDWINQELWELNN